MTYAVNYILKSGEKINTWYTFYKSLNNEIKFLNSFNFKE